MSYDHDRKIHVARNEQSEIHSLLLNRNIIIHLNLSSRSPFDAARFVTCMEELPSSQKLCINEAHTAASTAEPYQRLIKAAGQHNINSHV